MNRREFLKISGIGFATNVLPKAPDIQLSIEDERRQAFQAMLDFETKHFNDPIIPALLQEQSGLIDYLFALTYGEFISIPPYMSSISLLTESSGWYWNSSSDGTRDFVISSSLPPVSDKSNYFPYRYALEQSVVSAYCPTTGSTSFHAQEHGLSFSGFGIMDVDPKGKGTRYYNITDRVAAAFLAENMDLSVQSEKEAMLKIGFDLNKMNFNLLGAFKLMHNKYFDDSRASIGDVAKPYFMSTLPTYMNFIDRKFDVVGIGLRLINMIEGNNNFNSELFNTIVSAPSSFSEPSVPMQHGSLI
jgi:hypothetical protein